eukprot:SAG11_NODE_855_length_6868_cov_3.086128_1_plen_78_part_00
MPASRDPEESRTRFDMVANRYRLGIKCTSSTMHTTKSWPCTRPHSYVLAMHKSAQNNILRGGFFVWLAIGSAVTMVS